MQAYVDKQKSIECVSIIKNVNVINFKEKKEMIVGGGEAEQRDH